MVTMMGYVDSLGAAERAGANEEAPMRGKIVFFGAKDSVHKTATIQTVDLGLAAFRVVAEFEKAIILPGRVAPDARRVAFSVEREATRKTTVYVMDSTGRREEIIDDASVSAWSPDGTRLACVRVKGEGQWENFLVDVRTKQIEWLPVPRTDFVEDWSPDGAELSIMASCPERHFDHPEKGRYPLRQIYRIKLDGSGRVPLSVDPMLDNIWSRFSPDGSKVAHCCRRHEQGKVVEALKVVDRDGKNGKEIAWFAGGTHVRTNEAPCWSPDGKQILWKVVKEVEEGAVEFYRVLEHWLVFIPLDGSKPRQVKLTHGGTQWWGFVDWAR